MSSTFSIETHGGYQQTGEEAARMHARVHYGHDNFRFVSKDLTSTNEIRDGAWRLIRVQPIYTYTFEETE